MGQETFETNDGGGSDTAGQAPPPAPPAPPARPAPSPLPPPGPVVASGDRPLSAENLWQIEQANIRGKKIRKAGGMAMFNGIALSCFAGFSALFVLGSLIFGGFDVVGTVMAAGLGLAAFNEFKGRRLFRGFDRRAPQLLGWNQVCLMALVIGYCTWMIADAYFRPNPYADEIARAPMLAEMLGPMSELQWQLTLAIYGAVIVGAIVFQGLNAVYYFTRAKHLRAYLDETPDWVVDVQRRTAGQ